MARLNNQNNEKRNKRYKAESRREHNKIKKQERHLKRLAYFAKRRAA